MLIDSSPITYENLISDWQLGDDRVFMRDVPTALLPAGDQPTDAYLTLKVSPVDQDAFALVQKHITRIGSVAGQVIGFGLVINVFSADYQGLVNAGTVVKYDIRILTLLGHTFTIESGEIEFQQNVTQANTSGVPAVFPADGQPRFRGFTATQPDLIPFNSGLFNTGDFFINSNPLNGNGYMFFCLIGGTPGSWAALIPFSNGLPGPPGPVGPAGPPGPQGPPGSGGAGGDAHFKGYSATVPPVGSWLVGDFFLNANPINGAPEGWVYCTDGQWRTKGIVGESTGA